MAIIVQKFGGTSVGDVDRIRNVAQRVKKELDQGNQVAVIVSAMAGTTDHLVGLAQKVSSLSNDQQLAEYDSIVASGEQITSGLLALTLQSMNIPARSWLGWQIPLRTDSAYSRARIGTIDTNDVSAAIAKGEVAVVAGFQGIDETIGRITTLGRGGSDTSAVALAAALGADRCDIYTDVDGVYTTDPRIVPSAKKLDKITYEEMLELASLGAKVLQTRSVLMAMIHKVRVQVLTSFSDTPGTMLVDEEEVMEKREVSGLAYSKNEARVTLSDVANKPGVAASIFGPLSNAEINVDMIVQNVSEDGKRTDLTFTVARTDMNRAVESIKQAGIEYRHIGLDDKVVKVSVVGAGMRSHAGIAQTMFQTLAEKGINILVISTSEIKISVLIQEEYLELALRALHTAYGLDAKEE